MTPVTGPRDLRVGDEVEVQRSRDPIAWRGVVARVGSSKCLVQPKSGVAVWVAYEQADRRGTTSTEDDGWIYPISRVGP